MNYEAKLLIKQIISEDILAFSLEKPEGYEFIAGQFCFLNLPDIGYQDERGLRRHLSIASSPLENELLFATKISNSAFKRTLKDTLAGNRIIIEQPMGFFTLQREIAKPIIFLAGGIGITPFRSMIRYVLEAQTGHNVTLFYSNRILEEAVFLEELQTISEAHTNITVIPTMTRADQTSTPWEGLTGRINPSMIKDNSKDWRDSIYYIAGPPKMVDSMREILKDINIKSDSILVERFTGY